MSISARVVVGVLFPWRMRRCLLVKVKVKVRVSVGVSMRVSVRVVVGVTVAHEALLIGQGQSECWSQLER